MKIQLGDLLLQEQRVNEARKLFEDALEALPGDEAACHRLVLSYELSPGDSGAVRLLRLGESWEETVPAAALDAYEAAMRIAWSANPPLAETTSFPSASRRAEARARAASLQRTRSARPANSARWAGTLSLS
jgi:hypothetical protein